MHTSKSAAGLGGLITLFAVVIVSVAGITLFVLLLIELLMRLQPLIALIS